MLDFQAIKAIPLTHVLQKYGIALTFGGKYAKARCPLPTHKADDKDKNFNISLEGNYWKCWSSTCNEKLGAKGGDTINFVAAMEGISQHAAALKLSEWFHVSEQIKTAQPIATRSIKQPPKRTTRNGSIPSIEVKADTKGYMADVDAWFDDMIRRGEGESDEDYLHRVRNAVKSKLVLSFRNGKRVAAGLPLENS